METTVAVWPRYLNEVTDDVTSITVVAGDEVRRFVAERGGELYVWVSHHGCGRCGLALLEAETTRPRTRGLHFCRVRERGFDLLLDVERQPVAQDAGARDRAGAARRCGPTGTAWPGSPEARRNARSEKAAQPPRRLVGQRQLVGVVEGAAAPAVPRRAVHDPVGGFERRPVLLDA